MSALIYDMPEKDYRALPGLSGTGAVKILRSPAAYKASIDAPSKSTDAQRLGTLFHALTLGTDPHATISTFPNFKSKAAQEWRAEAEASGLTVVSRDMYDIATRMAERAREHSDAGHILAAPGPAEASLIWESQGAPMKGRIDKVWDGRVVDLKSISVPDGDFLDECNKAIGKWGMHVQTAHYREGLALTTESSHSKPPVLIFVESAAPFRVAVVELSDFDATAGRDLAREAARRYADCLAADAWPTGEPEGVQLSLIPAWSTRAWDRHLTTA